MNNLAGPSKPLVSPPRKRQRQGHLSRDEKQNVLNMYKIHLLQTPKAGTAAVVMNISDTLRIAKSTVYRTVKEYKKTGELAAPKQRTGRHSKVQGFDEATRNAVRQIVHSFFFKNELPTLDKILAQILIRDDIPQMSRATLHRFLKLINFKYVKRNKRNMLIEKDEIIRWRRRYLTTVKQYRNEGRPIFYLDETWVNEGHTKGKVWFDASIMSARQAFVEGLSTGLKSPSGKGRRLIVLHIGSESGFVEDGLLVFEGTKTVDYHEEMNSAVYEEWFEKILPKLPHNAVIVMDNASYHSRRSERLPTSSWRKADIKNWLLSKKIEFEPDLLRADLLHLAKIHKEQYNAYVTDEMAIAANKTVLRLPPYHCELNPIELVWSQIKGEVASKNTTFKMASIRPLLIEAVTNVTADKWKKCVDHVIKEERRMWELDGIMDDMTDPFIISVGDNDSETEFSLSSDSDNI